MEIKKTRMKWKHPVRNSILLALAVLVVGIAGYRLVSGWMDTLPKLKYTYGANVLPVKYPACKFAVLSDLHVYDDSLGVEGEAFQEYLEYDRKLLKESTELLDLAVDRILESGVEFVLVPGDLTKDGERINHELAARKLTRLTEKGVKVFVVPGNHDVANPKAYRYSGSQTEQVPSVTPQEFAEIYSGFGYGTALLRDSGSLSYVAEPVPGLWLLALDACRYQDNKPGEEAVTAGRLTQTQQAWIESVLKKANVSGKAVMVLMHHGVVEHWKGQSELHPEYLTEDWQHAGEAMASWGVRLAFTGHYHASDVAMADFGGRGFLLDVETGSLVTSPCPYRICSIDDDQYFRYAAEPLAGSLRPGTGFEQQSAQALRASVEGQAFATLRKYAVSEPDARTIAGHVAAAFAAHYAGSEDPSAAPVLDETRLNLWSRIVLATQRYVLDGLWHDTFPQDSQGTVDLFTGK